MDKKQSKDKVWYKKWWVWLIIAVVLISTISSAAKNNTATQQNAQSQTKTEQKQPTKADKPATTDKKAEAVVPQPELQKTFLSLIDSTKEAYTSAKTDLQRSEAGRNRNAQLCSAVGSQFTDWVGTVRSIGANNDGYAHVSVEISPSVKLSTWNNAVSDYQDNTLIKPGSELFDRLVKMQKGAKVTITGSFVASDDSCLKTSNLTKTFSALDPDFIVTFSDVREK